MVNNQFFPYVGPAFTDLQLTPLIRSLPIPRVSVNCLFPLRKLLSLRSMVVPPLCSKKYFSPYTDWSPSSPPQSLLFSCTPLLLLVSHKNIPLRGKSNSLFPDRLTPRGCYPTQSPPSSFPILTRVQFLSTFPIFLTEVRLFLSETDRILFLVFQGLRFPLTRPLPSAKRLIRCPVGHGGSRLFNFSSSPGF